MPARNGRSAGWTARMRSTRHAIVEAALACFVERGFDAVTIPQIAAAAEVSPRTVHRYFPHKEDLVLDRDEFPAFLAALDAAPDDVSPLDAVMRVLRGAAADLSDAATERTRLELILTTPSLHTAWLAALGALESGLRDWLARRTNRHADDVEIQVAAAALVATHRVLVETWTGDDLADYVTRSERAMQALAIGFDATLR